MGELLSGLGDLMFTLVIGYIGAIEFLYVVRHIYHWSFNHDEIENDPIANLAHLQEDMRKQLAAAEAVEANAGKKAMKDGVLYEDGFRIDPNQAEIDRLTEQLKNKSLSDAKRQELEKELAKQKKIEQETRKQLQEAEAALARDQQENERKLLEAERQREREQKRREEEAETKRKAEVEDQKRQEEEARKHKEAKENAQKMLAAEQERERDQRRREQEAEAERERQRRAAEEAERVENEQRILQAERERELAQRHAEEMEEIELQVEMATAAEHDQELTDNERKLIESIMQRELAEQLDDVATQKEDELLQRILQARDQLGEESEEEQSQRLFTQEQDNDAKQRRIEENARLFLEAEKEMSEIQDRMHELVNKREFAMNLERAPQTPVEEELCIKKTVSPLRDQTSPQPIAHRVKTQLAQNSDDSYSVSSKSLLFPGVSDDASSNEPGSSQKSSFSTQPSDEINTGNESQFPPQERQEPEGEDNAPTQQYSDDYLRSLDGIKQRPLSREDGSGRRRAFKKRRSSGSSNSSFDSRASRDEELKMFTSLEEEEMQNDQTDFAPIRYTSEPTLKVKGHHRRHKRSPAKDMRSSDDSQRSSLERLGEETINPWGDVIPEHYKETEFWKREKALSIDEEIELEKPTSSEEINYDTATNLPSASSFEEATPKQNEKALTNLTKTERVSKEEEAKAAAEEAAGSDINTNLQNFQITEREASPSRSSASPRLRRSPRIEEMNQYEERWKEFQEETARCTTECSVVNTPTITVDKPLDFGPWRDEYGLVMEGLSDFYDFTASVNPSRSRSASRNPSPANTAPNTPQPKNVGFIANSETEKQIEVYDDTNQLESGELTKQNIVEFMANESDSNAVIPPETSGNSISNHLQYVIDDQSRETSNISLLPMVNIIEDATAATSRSTEGDSSEEINSLIASLRSQHQSSRSRSTSPLPTVDTIQRSLHSRRNRRLKHNENILEKLSVTNMLPEMDAEAVINGSSTENTLETEKGTSTPNENESENQDDMNSLVASLRAQRSRSRSKSPLPTADNIQRSLESRRNKMIKHNEDILEKLIVNNMLPETDAELVEDASTGEKLDRLQVENRSRSRSMSRSTSRSRSPSPLPTPENLERGIEHRRNRRIQENDEYFKKLSERMSPVERNSQSPVALSPPIISIEITEPDLVTSQEKDEDICSREEIDALVQSLRVARSRSRSTTPIRQISMQVPSLEFNVIVDETAGPHTQTFEESNSRKEMDSLVQSLRVARSRTRSKSPMLLPTMANLSKSLESRRSKLIERNDELQQMLEERTKTPEPPQLTVEYVYEFVETSEELSTRSRLSRSHSISPSLSVDNETHTLDKEQSRSRTPSRSLSPGAHCGESEDSNFHVMLNLEGSHNKTLLKNSEEYETTLADRQKRLDIEALEKLKNASEEIELRTLSPMALDHEIKDVVTDLHVSQRGKMQRCSPTTPEYDRTISEEMRDVERIKQEMLDRGFKRSTYVGESMDLGSEYEAQRREAAHFQRSKSPTPLFAENEPGQMTAEEKRHFQDLVLQELTGSLDSARNTGAIPKAERILSTDSEQSLSTEVQDTLRIKEEILNSGFKRSTYVGQSIDASLELEEMRCRNAEFRRSASKSRSPLTEVELNELEGIEREAAKREMQDKVMDDLELSAINFQDFSRHLNPNFLDTDRRASDSALIQKPEILIQFQDNSFELDMEPEEYHHYRRFSLAQEQPMEEYPSDDYIFIQQVEVRTRSGSRTWMREDFYSQDINDFLLKESGESSESSLERKTTGDEDNGEKENIVEEEDEKSRHSGETSPDSFVEEIPADENLKNEQLVDNKDLLAYDLDGIEDDEESNGSDDRRTVIEVEDEIDEDFSDFNERGTAEESQHEQSECEEAEREMDRYAGREARDWAAIVDEEKIFSIEKKDDSEGAFGGAASSPYDSDSFAIDQIYDEAIKNRKQSGILKEFDSILNEMTESFIQNSNKDIDEQYALWSKMHKKPKNVEFNINFLESERKDSEMRYLGDAAVSARQSTRLRSRYGYNPVLQTSTTGEDIEVDLNYKPKREYNWRKNFKLDDDGNMKKVQEVENNLNDQTVEWDLEENTSEKAEIIDLRKYSLGGESITLFSRSPEKEIQVEDFETVTSEIVKEKETEEPAPKIEQDAEDKPKKKKNKKKTRRGSKASIEAESLAKQEEADESYVASYSRRSSSTQLETDSPKRKSRSRRSSRASLAVEDSSSLLSPRSSIGGAEPIGDIMEEYTEVQEITRPKKLKKRKKVKEIMDVMADVTESLNEDLQHNETQGELQSEETIEVSAVVMPDSSTSNLLSALSPQESVCVTPASLESESNGNLKSTTASTTSPTQATTVTTPVDTFDILKDANFYPLF